jgi:hypothetical protein
VFAGVDVYNDGDEDAMVRIRSAEGGEVSYRIKAKELRRVRTGWTGASSGVVFAVERGEGLRFDNLAWERP